MSGDRFAKALAAEHRPGVYAAHPSHVVHPNGTLIASTDAAFLGAATRAVLAMYREDAA